MKRPSLIGRSGTHLKDGALVASWVARGLISPRLVSSATTAFIAPREVFALPEPAWSRLEAMAQGEASPLPAESAIHLGPLLCRA